MISPETRMMGLPYGKEITIVGRTMWTQSTSVTDGRIDRRTELRSQRPCNAERRTVKIVQHLAHSVYNNVGDADDDDDDDDDTGCHGDNHQLVLKADRCLCVFDTPLQQSATNKQRFLYSQLYNFPNVLNPNPRRLTISLLFYPHKTGLGQ